MRGSYKAHSDQEKLWREPETVVIHSLTPAIPYAIKRRDYPLFLWSESRHNEVTLLVQVSFSLSNSSLLKPKYDILNTKYFL